MARSSTLRLSRQVWTQLAILAGVTIIAIGVMAFGFVKVPGLLGIGRYTVTVELPASGGLTSAWMWPLLTSTKSTLVGVGNAGVPHCPVLARIHASPICHNGVASVAWGCGVVAPVLSAGRLKRPTTSKAQKSATTSQTRRCPTTQYYHAEDR